MLNDSYQFEANPDPPSPRRSIYEMQLVCLSVEEALELWLKLRRNHVSVLHK